MAKVAFYKCSQEAFNSEKNNSRLEAGGLYFITDRSVIIEATGADTFNEYGGVVHLVSSFPVSNQLTNVLYVNASTKTGKIWDPTLNSNSGGWVTVFAPGSATGSIVSGNTDAVSGGTVYTYLTSTDNVTDVGGSGNGGKLVKTNGDGKIASTMLPAVVVSNYLGSVDQVSGATSPKTDLSSLVSMADAGDWARVTDDPDESKNGSYIYTVDLSSNPNNTTASWVRLADKLDEITIDSSVTESSNNPVKSSGIYTAIEGAKLTWTPIPDPSGT